MYCPSCGSEITVELKYCNRCGANLSLTPVGNSAPIKTPIKLVAPTVVLGLTITIGLGIIFSSARELAQLHMDPGALAWMVIFGLATLFGVTALLLRFWAKMFASNQESHRPPQNVRPIAPANGPQQHLPPHFEPVPSVTEHTTRTFSRPYDESSDPAAR